MSDLFFHPFFPSFIWPWLLLTLFHCWLHLISFCCFIWYSMGWPFGISFNCQSFLWGPLAIMFNNLSFRHVFLLPLSPHFIGIVFPMIVLVKLHYFLWFGIKSIHGFSLGPPHFSCLQCNLFVPGNWEKALSFCWCKKTNQINLSLIRDGGSSTTWAGAECFDTLGLFWKDNDPDVPGPMMICHPQLWCLESEKLSTDSFTNILTLQRR